MSLKASLTFEIENNSLEQYGRRNNIEMTGILEQYGRRNNIEMTGILDSVFDQNLEGKSCRYFKLNKC